MTTGSAGEHAYSVMHAQLESLREQLPTAQNTDDAEAVHDFRVALRRLRVALAFFTDLLPSGASAYRDRFGRLGSPLGAVRDLDLQVEQIAAWAATACAEDRKTIAAVEGIVDERRREARFGAVASLRAPATRRLLENFARFLDRGPPKRSSLARTAALDLAPELITQEHRKLVAIGDSTGPDATAEALHALRIRCKRLRYSIELFEPSYGAAAKAYIRRLVDMQELLGTHQDAIVIATTLREIALDPAQRLQPGQLFLLGAFAERCHVRARQAHGLLPSTYARISGRRWKRLVRAMGDVRSVEIEPAEDVEVRGA